MAVAAASLRNSYSLAGADLIDPHAEAVRAHRGSLGQQVESTVRYLGVEVDDALEIAEKIDV